MISLTNLIEDNQFLFFIPHFKLHKTDDLGWSAGVELHTAFIFSTCHKSKYIRFQILGFGFSWRFILR